MLSIVYNNTQVMGHGSSVIRHGININITRIDTMLHSSHCCCYSGDEIAPSPYAIIKTPTPPNRAHPYTSHSKGHRTLPPIIQHSDVLTTAPSLHTVVLSCSMGTSHHRITQPTHHTPRSPHCRSQPTTPQTTCFLTFAVFVCWLYSSADQVR